DGNTITTAEHTIALLVALARRVPQANSSLKSGKWVRKNFIGTELMGKTLGIIGLGRIGRVVADRARALGMKILAYDPFVAPEQARDLEIETASFEDAVTRSDFLTIHTPLTAETRGIIGPDAFARMKQGVRVINCARGGLVDEAALYQAIKSGKLAGIDAAPVTRAFLAGLLRDVSARVNLVNAFLIADERRVAVTTSYVRSGDVGTAMRTKVITESEQQSIAGTVFGIAQGEREGRITEINDFRIEAIPRGYMLVMHNHDVPGVIGRVGTILGERGINISAFHLGRRERGGEAMAVIQIDADLDAQTIAQVRAFEPVIS